MNTPNHAKMLNIKNPALKPLPTTVLKIVNNMKPTKPQTVNAVIIAERSTINMMKPNLP